jgi:hypothetical protein
MTRYKGRLSIKTIEKEFPHIVEMAVPGCGFQRKADDMEAWHRERGLNSKHGYGEYREPVWYVRWCFLNEADADAFSLQFAEGRLPGPAKGQVSRRGQR